MTTYTADDAQEPIRDAIALALELPDYTGADGTTVFKAVEWADRETAQGMTEDVYCRLRLRSVVQTMRAETRTELVVGDTPADSYQIVRTGAHVAVTVSVEINSRSQDPTKHALSRYAGKLRARLDRDDVQAILVAGNVSLAHVYGSVDDSWWNQGRKESKSVTDLVFLTTEWDENADTTNGYIASVQGTGTFTGGATGAKTAELEQDDTTPP